MWPIFVLKGNVNLPGQPTISVVECTRWQHQGWSLPSLTTFCSLCLLMLNLCKKWSSLASWWAFNHKKPGNVSWLGNWLLV